jgi:hypothetical protein
MAVTMTSTRRYKRLIDEAAKVLGAKSRTDAVHKALHEFIPPGSFKKLMKKHTGKLEFAGHDR